MDSRIPRPPSAPLAPHRPPSNSSLQSSIIHSRVEALAIQLEMERRRRLEVEQRIQQEIELCTPSKTNEREAGTATPREKINLHVAPQTTAASEGREGGSVRSGRPPQPVKQKISSDKLPVASSSTSSQRGAGPRDVSVLTHEALLLQDLIFQQQQKKTGILDRLGGSNSFLPKPSPSIPATPSAAAAAATPQQRPTRLHSAPAQLEHSSEPRSKQRDTGGSRSGSSSYRYAESGRRKAELPSEARGGVNAVQFHQVGGSVLKRLSKTKPSASELYVAGRRHQQRMDKLQAFQLPGLAGL